MKYFVALGFLIFTLNSQAQTQLEQNLSAFDEFKLADKNLNITYNKVIKMHSIDTLFVKNLRISQRLWVKFRDAEMAMKYPEYGGAHYGSMQPFCAAEYKTKLTKERTKRLYEWVKGVEDGSICSGSARNNGL
tara:strand:- start:299 stop:697 length:399 start_codon:yes stop_codon:yes gene_type:complete